MCSKSETETISYRNSKFVEITISIQILICLTTKLYNRYTTMIFYNDIIHTTVYAAKCRATRNYYVFQKNYQNSTDLFK